MAYESLRVAGAKRATTPEKKNRFQQGRLAGAVAAPDQILPGVKTKLSALDAAHIIDNKLGETHSPKLSLNLSDVDMTSAKIHHRRRSCGASAGTASGDEVGCGSKLGRSGLQETRCLIWVTMSPSSGSQISVAGSRAIGAPGTAGL